MGFIRHTSDIHPTYIRHTTDMIGPISSLNTLFMRHTQALITLHPLQFSRELRSLWRLNSDFTPSKLSNFLENWWVCSLYTPAYMPSKPHFSPSIAQFMSDVCRVYVGCMSDLCRMTVIPKSSKRQNIRYITNKLCRMSNDFKIWLNIFFKR